MKKENGNENELVKDMNVVSRFKGCVGFIGAGKVGNAFGHYLIDRGVKVVGYYSRTYESAAVAAEFTGTQVFSIDDLIKKCDYIFITTSDNHISDVWNQIKKENLQDKKIFHMSGSLASDLFDGIEDLRAQGYSLHPLFPFTDKNSYQQLGEVVFTIEGKDIASIEVFLNACQIRYIHINEEDKAKYHAAAVFASNYVTVMAKVAKELFMECGLSNEEANKAIYSLMEGTVQNIKKHDVENSLTGPVIRGDTLTITKHLEVLDDEKTKQLYCALGNIATEIAFEKGTINGEKNNEILKILGGE